MNKFLSYSWPSKKQELDVLEFFIYFEGKRNATLEEIELWVNENINDIIGRFNNHEIV